ncbi:MAG: serine hydrolase domain-containing protein, partial [Pseudomonadota bacterium]
AAANDGLVAVEASWHEKIAARTMEEIDLHNLPSIQLAVGFRGKLIYENAFGYSDIASRTRATIATQYRTASISKWLTGAATFKLVDEGKIALDQPIQRYCPAYPAKSAPITTRQLLSHTAGVRHYPDRRLERDRSASKAQRELIRSQRERDEKSNAIRFTDTIAPIAFFKDDPLIFPPGRGYAYSSFGFRVLGCVIAGAAGEPYRDFLRASLFEPLRMDSTQPDDSAATLPSRATLYDLSRKGKLKLAPVRDVSANLPAGGHLSTASDLIRYTLAFANGEVLTPSSRKIMGSQPKGPNGEEIPSGYGHGVDFMSDFPGSLGHSGRQSGTTTLLLYLPEYDASIAVMSNASGWRTITPFTAEILTILESHVEELG